MIPVSIEKRKQYQERARLKQLAKINSPEYQAKQRAKAEAAFKRKLEKAKAKSQESYPVKPSLPASKPHKHRKKLKSKGMVGISRNKSEIELHDKMAKLGCICCINQGLISPFSGGPVSIHHFDGRTKEGCHKKVLPLCAWHHDTPIPTDHPYIAQHPNVFPIHAKGSVGGKVPWEKVNGKQDDLLLEVLGYLGIATLN
ncbi:Ref family recombination enhancement nuclease [Alteromonas gilva]|uniref:Ref family recombination enhancement nuclease n=1 Tax=Alteromonas gilva TaxID=2987522 RepID=A0ABT5L8D9_9ALTE|nr:Ref family recombination enhancement nuclease [Alteromonas gilva]MDC8832826.1 Ref family recombination enhancement nuclease [Alteromonas gilva]